MNAFDVIDIPEIGKFYEDVFSGDGVIYECIEIKLEDKNPFIMKECWSGHVAPYQSIGWKLVK